MLVITCVNAVGFLLITIFLTFALQEAKEKSQYLLQKAQEQMEEQEDEIKKLNEIILNARCHAIRDEQLVEKTEIKQEQLEEDKRYEEFFSNISSNIEH